MSILRRKTRALRLGDVGVGGDYPITIQSMTNTPTADVQATVRQIRELQAAGCEIIRVTVNHQEAADALPEIISSISIPIIADIHFDHKLALAAINAGVDGLRLNPGNIGSERKVQEVVAAARERKIPIRIGVNTGSMDKEIYQRYGVTAEGLVESALKHVHILEQAGYEEMKISVKASSVPLMLASYRLLSKRVDYPLHLGVTEAGTMLRGTIKSAMGIGILLEEGIGDTIRVSLTSDPVDEVNVGRQILQALGLRKGLEVISCPTCGRTEIDLVKIAEEVEAGLAEYRDKDLRVAVMGCIVNGPGEAKEADFGLAGGKGEGILFCKGEIVKKVPEESLVAELLQLVRSQID
ncbi:MAG: flavodoxin-dependent (E)-4-hydroxy-3-methylbut-2-enyl-diphosphate synthase [Candidatus Stygibacter australis]|nr:flavodoxin-dependent (E)-4-hydroxy-3-methylbut-2-enyl-diphosphate synthase [Candidatus Stygibacter australis]MDP8322051.1 flavodoxin-dependent (E)-4-hydroxy-3-methylbut-2-enyl-diphosphate synthase [Candidatus Stygibacter australis]